ncbi:MAG: hypothetical protein AB9897_06260 [Anaerolineaceae bacterium]
MKPLPEIPYIQTKESNQRLPLDRYLPTCPAGIVEQYCSVNSWVLDPFGSNPLMSLEAAKAGLCVLVTCNNPIVVFMLKMLAHPQSRMEYLSVLSALASQTRGGERLETHIKELYLTRCVICHQLIPASGFLWRRNESAPYARVYHCENCGDEGERAVSEEDLRVLQPLKRGEPLHRGRALSRVLHGNEEDRPAVEDALKVYNARALYVLFSLLNKIEGMTFSIEERSIAEAMMISLLDAGTSLWSWPISDEQPRQLTLPAVYYEKNLWIELERSIDLWSQPTPIVELTTYPDLPAGAGICLFPGPVRDLVLPPDGIDIESLLCLPPRPNQAFWTLSALWSAWLWERDISNSFSQVLGRRRFDWHWHTQALSQAFENAAKISPKSIPVYMQIGEPSAGMVFAVSAASTFAGYKINGIAMKSPDAPIQSIWQTGASVDHATTANPQAVARQAIRDLLLKLGEPVDYLFLFTAAVEAIANQHCFPKNVKDFSQEKSTELQNLIAHLFEEVSFLRRFDATSQELESGKWGLVNWQGAQMPLADRVEEFLVQLLQTESVLDDSLIHQKLNSNFTGFCTPATELVDNCLTSYAVLDPITGSWKIREKEMPGCRNKDLHDAFALLFALGNQLEYECGGEQMLYWKEKGKIIYQFFFTAGALLNQYLSESQTDEIQSVLVLPGSRAGLLKFKLERDANLREKTAHQWHFLKLRTLQTLSGQPDLTQELWQMQLDSDPINIEETTQLRIFG